ncbi:MAG: tetratricopeptide repeat protein [Burkholderiales bacterium]
MKKPVIAASLTLLTLLALGLPAAADDLEEAYTLFKKGSHAQAQDKVSSFLSAHPKDAKARFLLGLIYTEQNHPDEAIKIFTGLTEDFPDLPEPYNNLAVLYASQGQYDKARTDLEAAIRTHPSYATAHENLGDIYAKLATQEYDKALQLDKNNTTAQTKLELIKDLFSGSPRAARTTPATISPTR